MRYALRYIDYFAADQLFTEVFYETQKSIVSFPEHRHDNDARP